MRLKIQPFGPKLVSHSISTRAAISHVKIYQKKVATLNVLKMIWKKCETKQPPLYKFRAVKRIFQSMECLINSFVIEYLRW